MALEVKEPVRGINEGARPSPVVRSNKYPLTATTTRGPLAQANGFTSGSRLARPIERSAARRVTQRVAGRRSSGGSHASLRKRARTIVP